MPMHVCEGRGMLTLPQMDSNHPMCIRDFPGFRKLSFLKVWLKPVSHSIDKLEQILAFKISIGLDENASITSAPKFFSLGSYVETEKEKENFSLPSVSQDFPNFFPPPDFNFSML